ncbi:hypothetical protein GCM10028820_04990 [Tessaracoccus terricola]
MDATKRSDGADGAGSRAARGVGAAIGAALQALEQVDHDREHASDAERLEWLLAAQQLARRTEALHKQLVAEADAAGSSMRLHGTPTTSWLALDGKLSTREAAGLVNSGKKICSHPEVIKQSLSGNITPTQATAITKVMDELPVTLTPEEVKRAQDILISRMLGTLPPRTSASPPAPSSSRFAPHPPRRSGSPRSRSASPSNSSVRIDAAACSSGRTATAPPSSRAHCPPWRASHCGG